MEDNKTESSHQTLLNATGIFGFTQVLKMLIGVVGSKCVAVFLGPMGIGIVGLLNNTLNMIASFTNFGLNLTSVREVTLAKAENDPKQFSRRFHILQRWSFIVGVLGTVVSILFSKYFSEWTFGSTQYYIWFIALSINFVFMSLTIPRVALLQGLRMLKPMAVSNILSSLLITLVTIPIYYFFKLDGILPVIILSGFIGLLVHLYFTRNIKMERVSLSILDTFKNGLPIMKLGFLLSINVIFGQIGTYIIKLYLNGNGTTSEILGFYEVSTVISVSYVGIIFNAMSLDFYPRLIAVSHDFKKINNLVNDQIEMGLLLITPLIVLFYLLAPLLIQILYTKDFLGVLLILKALLFSLIIKAIIWPLAYIILAKGQKRLYFKQELLGDFLNIISTLVLYHFYGLIGIGIASVLNYIIYGVYVYTILHTRFQFVFRKETFWIIIGSFFIGLTSCISLFWLDYPHAYYVFVVLLVLSLVYSYKQLNQRIDMGLYWKKIISQLKKG